MNKLAIERHEQLAAFCETLDAHRLWVSDIESSRHEKTVLTLAYEQDGRLQAPLELLARRYHNAGRQALKVNFWTTGACRIYLGTLGYHNQMAEPYCKLTERSYDEAKLYSVLGAAVLVGQESDIICP